MKIAMQKKIYWLLLAMNLGYVVLICIAFALAGFKLTISTALVVSVVLSIAISILSLFKLRRCYRLEPAEVGGYWHVSIADCFVATMFSAFCMGLWQNLWPENFLYSGAAVSIIAGIWYLCSMLVAERRGAKSFMTKIVMATGLMFKSYGMMAFGSTIAIALYIPFQAGQMSYGFEFLRGLLGINFLLNGRTNLSLHYWVEISLRLGLIVFPIGLMITWVMKKSEKSRQQDVAK